MSIDLVEKQDYEPQAIKKLKEQKKKDKPKTHLDNEENPEDVKTDD